MTKKNKRKAYRPRKPKKSIDDFVMDIEQDRMANQEQEFYGSSAPNPDVERYVRQVMPTCVGEDEDSFSFWYGKN